MSDLRFAVNLELPGVARMVETARLKAAPPLAPGDCFAVATAAAHGLPLLTGDPSSMESSDRQSVAGRANAPEPYAPG